MESHEVNDNPLSNAEGQPLPVGRGWPEFVKQAFLIACAIIFYFAVRGVTQGSSDVAIDNGFRILELEERLALDLELTAQRLVDDSRIIMTLANWTYIWLHWPVIIVTLVWLHRTRRYEYLLLRNSMFISGGLGLIVFMLFPVAPPRLLDIGFLDTVTEFSNSYRILQPPALVNKYAAVPSLHVGWNLLVGIALYRSAHALRVFAIATPIAMATAVVVTGNHYIVDGVAGAVLALLSLGIAMMISPGLARHRFDPFHSEPEVHSS
jgi:membrane-associated phospholipid phosphatase